ncbi:rust resistance kinase Lr10-like [Herrania umbratica]|uniref:Rust resistance kinase Lr10-like n=1 Tax=Herrania umbratica TaxID=108875 RepID=A0A6J1A8A4_9ROSI|nr:rust resistance kinase Lr10-like [Herrania umbratica]
MHLGRFVCTKFSLLHLFLLCCGAKTLPYQCQKPSSCGQILNISHPFGLKGDPGNCSEEPLYQLECENDNTVFYSKALKYYVLAINYQDSTIRVVDAGLLQRNNCSSLPFRSFSSYDLQDDFLYLRQMGMATVLYLSCENPVDSSHYIDTRPCTHGVYNPANRSSMERQYYSYVMLGNRNVSEIADHCRIDMVVKSSSPTIYSENLSYADIHNQLLYGFQLGYSWVNPDLDHCGFLCMSGIITADLFGNAASLIALIIVVGRLCTLPLVVAFLIYKWRRRHLSMFDMVEDFLQSQNNLMPIKYSFSEIKKMTNGFKTMLGEGGYSFVYKGKLRSGRIVAVKILGKSKCNGQEFINEVITIGRIHHANVVQLIGFCAERSKRALVYEFMANGSLEKYIFSQESGTSLSCKKMYEISIGVARGIEYLHKGCDMQILHFDIKPHNILLDENFIPKVSDFGLAKLYPIEDSMVPHTAARGTMGYMAPELFYKNIGGISYKADVYSFGMLLMEMVSKRKNLNAFAEHSSQIYFPSWVFDQLSLGKEIEIGEITDEEKEIVKKMVMVSLWCIQMKPSNRPSMNKVVEMLENEVCCLQMPPTPFNLV